MKAIVNLTMHSSYYKLIDNDIIYDKDREIEAKMTIELSNGNFNEIKVKKDGRVFVNETLIHCNLNELIDQLEIAKKALTE